MCSSSAPCVEGYPECPICFHAKDCATLGCGHKFCVECLLRQLKTEHRCAVCRQPMQSCSPSMVQPRPSMLNRRICITDSGGGSDAEFDVIWRASSTVVDSVNAAAARCGICVGDVVLAVNGIACTSKSILTDVMNDADSVTIHVCRPMRYRSLCDFLCDCLNPRVPLRKR